MDVNCEGLLKGKVDIETVKVPLNAGKEFFRQNPMSYYMMREKLMSNLQKSPMKCR